MLTLITNKTLELKNGKVIYLNSPRDKITVIEIVNGIYNYWKPQPDWIVVDIGAHIGSFSISIIDKVKRVYAVEPTPILFIALVSNIFINKLESKIIPINLALTDKEEVAIFYQYVDTAANSLYQHKTYKGEEIRVVCVRLDTLQKLYSIDRIDLLKIDAEGSEVKIISSLKGNLPKRIAIAHYHSHYFNVEDYINLNELIISKGYKRVKENNHTAFYELIE